MKKLLMWGEKPKPKKAQSKGVELKLLSEVPRSCFEMRRADKNADSALQPVKIVSSRNNNSQGR